MPITAARLRVRAGTLRRSLRPLLVVALTAATLTVVQPSPATADPTAAMNRCTQGQVPNHDSPNVTVLGNGGGSDPAGPNPGNILDPGDAFIIVPDTSTTVSVDYWGSNYGAGGNGVSAPAGWPFPGLAEFSAVLRFNNNPGGWVGSPVQAVAYNRCTTFSGVASSRLLFYVNDTNTGDNSGAWKFHVLIYKASAPATTAMNRCSQASTADRNDLVSVYANGGGSDPTGVNPGNIVYPGDVVRIVPDYSSTATIDYWGTWYGPDGNGVSAPSGGGWPFPGLFEYGPVLRFNNNPAGWVGDPVQATALGGCLNWTSSYPVRLLFYVNDANTGDNSGYWKFQVLIYHA